MANGSAAVAPSQSRPSNWPRQGLQHADNTHTRSGASTHVLSYSHYSCSLPQVAGNFYFRSHFVFVSCSILPASSRPSERPNMPKESVACAEGGAGGRRGEGKVDWFVNSGS